MNMKVFLRTIALFVFLFDVCGSVTIQSKNINNSPESNIVIRDDVINEQLQRSKRRYPFNVNNYVDILNKIEDPSHVQNDLKEYDAGGEATKLNILNHFIEFMKKAVDQKFRSTSSP